MWCSPPWSSALHCPPGSGPRSNAATAGTFGRCHSSSCLARRHSTVAIKEKRIQKISIFQTTKVDKTSLNCIRLMLFRYINVALSQLICLLTGSHSYFFCEKIEKYFLKHQCTQLNFIMNLLIPKVTIVQRLWSFRNDALSCACAL